MSKSLMIIGAGPGIGQSVARRFGQEGWNIVLGSRNEERLRGLAAELAGEGIAAHAVPVDATDPIALRSALAGADRITGGLSAVHFNAAVVRLQDLFTMTDAEVEQDLAINVAAGLHTIRAAVERFGDRGGTILVTGGGLATAPHETYASLGVGKAALRNIVQALAEPLGARGMRIAIASVATLVNPGSAEADGVAHTLWKLATDKAAPWEAAYPV